MAKILREMKVLTARVIFDVGRLVLWFQKRRGRGSRIELRRALEVRWRMMCATIQRVVLLVRRVIMLALVVRRHTAITYCATSRWRVVATRRATRQVSRATQLLHRPVTQLAVTTCNPTKWSNNCFHKCILLFSHLKNFPRFSIFGITKLHLKQYY